MTKMIIAQVLIVIVLSILGYYGIIKPLGKLRQEINKMESKIGSRVIYQKDTVMLIDYSILNETYTLSTGIKVSMKLINELDSIPRE